MEPSNIQSPVVQFPLCRWWLSPVHLRGELRLFYDTLQPQLASVGKPERVGYALFIALHNSCGLLLLIPIHPLQFALRVLGLQTLALVVVMLASRQCNVEFGQSVLVDE